MTKEKQSKSWVDPRLIRPAGWTPPKMTEKSYSRLLDSYEGKQKKIIISGQLSTLHGAALMAYQCHLFYTDNLSPSILFGNYWSPWRSSGEVSTIIRALIPHVEPDIQEFCRVWLTQIQVLDELNQKWAITLAKFLNLAIPKSEDEFQVLQNSVESYRKENGAAWATLPEIQPLVLQIDTTVIKMQQLIPKLQELIQTMHSQFSPDDLQALAGNQRVQDQIEASRDEPSHKRAINKLNRILKNNPTQTQSSQIFTELGFRYSELGEIPQAIENYTKSIDLAKLPNALVYFWRGELYYREKQWLKAVKDFKQAIALEIYTPEREQAMQYISELQSK
jgi:tetratricopeptide (TPR) repeat protein